MVSGRLATLMRHICNLPGVRTGNLQTDGQLLQRFVAQRDQAAFAALITRHGPMVLRLCRRVLKDDHDAEDAFQATFLLLVRKAATIAKHESVGSWLYGVAYRLAVRAKATARRRRPQGDQVDDMPVHENNSASRWQHLQPILAEEVSRLPEKYRQPVVLCYLEGKAYEEAALHLGWPAGTVSGRLARAREILRRRLVRRGAVLNAALIASLLGQGAASASVQPALAKATLRAALQFAAGSTKAGGAVSVSVAAMVDSMMKAMLVDRIRLLALSLLVVALCGTGMMLFLQYVTAGKTTANAVAASPDARVVAKDYSPLATLTVKNFAVSSVSFIGNSEFATVQDDGKVTLWNLADSKERGSFTVPGLSGMLVAFSPDGKALASAKYGQLRLWETNTGKGLVIPGWPRSTVGSLEFSPDGKTLAIALRGVVLSPMGVRVTTSGEIKLWDVVSGKDRSTLAGAADLVAFSPDGKLLAAGTPEKLKLWDLATSQVVAEWAGAFPQDAAHSRDRIGLAFAPHGRKLFTTGAGLLKQWDLASCQEAWSKPHSDLAKARILALAVAPDGNTVVTGGDDGNAKVWNAHTGQEVAILQGQEGVYVTSLAFSPNGKVLAAGCGNLCERHLSNEYSARLWTVPGPMPDSK